MSMMSSGGTGRGPRPCGPYWSMIVMRNRRLMKWRGIARVGGINNKMPMTSLMKPGMIMSTAPVKMRKPSITSDVGTRPSDVVRRKRRNTAKPSRLSSHTPRMPMRMSNAIVYKAPIAWPTWTIT